MANAKPILKWEEFQQVYVSLNGYERSGRGDMGYRARVPGGWLYRAPGQTVSVTYIPDPAHEWDLASE